MKRNYTKSEYSESWLDNGVIYQIISLKVKKISLEIAKQLVKDRTYAMGTVGLNVTVYVVVNNAMSVDSEAKKYYKLPEAYENIGGIAMLVDNYGARLVGNLIFKINRSQVPTAFFNKEEKALEWLKQFEFLN